MSIERYGEFVFGDFEAICEKTWTETIATVCPISAAIDESHRSLRFYESGVCYEPKCSSRDLDHAVLVDGYGTDSRSGDYLIVENSRGIW